MKTLYLSDLDGTLLNSNVELSPYTIDTINSLIKQGIHFTIATARTSASVDTILAPLHINIPVILMNGVLIYNVETKKYAKVHYISEKAFLSINKVIKENNLTGFMYEVKDHKLTTYYERMENSFMKDFHDERVSKYQKVFKQVPDFNEIAYKHIVYFSILDLKERLEPAYEALKSITDISVTLYKDIYSEENTWFLEIFSNKATKYNAANYLRTSYHYDYMVGFGDNINDLPLFKACDETCAVANAKEELKAISSHVIQSNQEDGVANWLKDNVLKRTFFYDTNIGRIGITEKKSAITEIFFAKDIPTSNLLIEETPLIKEAAVQLKEYFEGNRQSFSFPLSPEGTPFQKKVWEALQFIPYGETWSYKKIAEAVGNPKASRAVGMANNRNPIVVVIPCHRVIGADGKLVGYGGGLEKKEYLLNLEAKQIEGRLNNGEIK